MVLMLWARTSSSPMLSSMPRSSTAPCRISAACSVKYVKNRPSCGIRRANMATSKRAWMGATARIVAGFAHQQAPSSHLDLDPHPVQEPPLPAVEIVQHLHARERGLVGEDGLVRRDVGVDVLHRVGVGVAGADGVGQLGGIAALEHEIHEAMR